MSNGFFCAKAGQNSGFRVMLKCFEIKKAFRYYIKQIDSMLPCVWFSNSSQKTSKCGKNISGILGYASSATYLFLPHFDVICELLLNRCTATWNLFVNYFLFMKCFFTAVWLMMSHRLESLMSKGYEIWRILCRHLFIKVSSFDTTSQTVSIFQSHRTIMLYMVLLINLVRLVITGKSQTLALSLGLRFPCNDRMDEVSKLFIIWPF